MDFHTITLTKEQYEDLEKRAKRIEQLEANISRVFKLLTHKDVYLLSNGNPEKPLESDIFVKEVTSVDVTHSNTRVNIYFNY